MRRNVYLDHTVEEQVFRGSRYPSTQLSMKVSDDAPSRLKAAVWLTGIIVLWCICQEGSQLLFSSIISLALLLLLHCIFLLLVVVSYLRSLACFKVKLTWPLFFIIILSFLWGNSLSALSHQGETGVPGGNPPGEHANPTPKTLDRSCCEATVLTTAPQCSSILTLISMSSFFYPG